MTLLTCSLLYKGKEEMVRRRSRAFSLIPNIVAAEKRRESRPFRRQSTKPEVSWGPSVGKRKAPKFIGNPTVEDVRKMLAKNPTNVSYLLPGKDPETSTMRRSNGIFSSSRANCCFFLMQHVKHMTMPCMRF